MKEVVEWLPDIWLAMAEENEDMDLIRGCLNLCSSAANDLFVKCSFLMRCGILTKLILYQGRGI